MKNLTATGLFSDKRKRAKSFDKKLTISDKNDMMSRWIFAVITQDISGDCQKNNI